MYLKTVTKERASSEINAWMEDNTKIYLRQNVYEGVKLIQLR
jgi:hypothetical protein